MEKHPIQGGVEILLVASYYRNWDKLQPDGLLGLYADFTLTCHSLTHCPSCPLAYRAATKDLHSCLSPANYCNSAFGSAPLAPTLQCPLKCHLRNRVSFPPDDMSKYDSYTILHVIHRLMNPPAKKNEAYQPTTVEQTANIITHGVRIITHLNYQFRVVDWI